MGVAVMIQLMGVLVLALSLIEQRQTLMHPKTVLLVHHDQAELMERHRVLKQGVGADDQLDFASFEHLEGFAAGLRRQLSRHPTNIYSQSFQPLAETAQVLLRQQLGWGHEGDLIPALDGLKGGEGRDHGFTRADITLDKPVHWRVTNQITADFRHHPVLRVGEGEGQALLEPLGQPAGRGNRVRRLSRQRLAAKPQAQVMGQELFERKPALGRMRGELDGLEPGVRWRAMGDLDRLDQRGESQWLQHR